MPLVYKSIFYVSVVILQIIHCPIHSQPKQGALSNAIAHYSSKLIEANADSVLLTHTTH